jgi:hypothetical protein
MPGCLHGPRRAVQQLTLHGVVFKLLLAPGRRVYLCRIGGQGWIVRLVKSRVWQAKHIDGPYQDTFTIHVRNLKEFIDLAEALGPNRSAPWPPSGPGASAGEN